MSPNPHCAWLSLANQHTDQGWAWGSLWLSLCIKKKVFLVRGHSFNDSLQGSPEKKGAPRKVGGGGMGMGMVCDPDQAYSWLSQLSFPEFVYKEIPQGSKLLPRISLASYPTLSEPLPLQKP